MFHHQPLPTPNLTSTLQGFPNPNFYGGAARPPQRPPLYRKSAARATWLYGGSMGGPQPETWGGLGGPLQKMSVDHEGVLCSAATTYSAKMSLKLRKFVHIKAILANFYQFRVKFSQVFHTPHHFVLFISATKFKP